MRAWTLPSPPLAPRAPPHPIAGHQGEVEDFPLEVWARTYVHGTGDANRLAEAGIEPGARTTPGPQLRQVTSDPGGSLHYEFSDRDEYVSAPGTLGHAPCPDVDQQPGRSYAALLPNDPAGQRWCQAVDLVVEKHWADRLVVNTHKDWGRPSPLSGEFNRRPGVTQEEHDGRSLLESEEEHSPGECPSTAVVRRKTSMTVKEGVAQRSD